MSLTTQSTISNRLIGWGVAELVAVTATVGLSILAWRRGHFGFLRTFTKSYTVSREVNINGVVNKIEYSVVPTTHQAMNKLTLKQCNWRNWHRQSFSSKTSLLPFFKEAK